MPLYDFRFYHWEKKTPNYTFLRQPFANKWETYTWAEAGQMARKLAAGLHSLGLPPKSHIGLMSKNCREWVITDIAITMAGYVSVPFYANLHAEQVKELIKIGDVKALFAGKLENWSLVKEGVPKDIPLITYPKYENHSEIPEAIQWHDFINNHDPIKGTPSSDLEDIWSIVFTSGTTGTPKGVVISYAASESTKVVTEQNNHLDISLEGENKFFSFLPLNHIAERVVVEHTCIRYGGSISFAESLVTFPQNLKETQPTLFFAVPRIWTKFQLGILSKIPQTHLNAALAGPDAEGLKKKLRLSLGMDNARGVLSGAASIPESLKDWFRKIGINIAEGYGMTENCALCTCLEAKDMIPGTVGPALPAVSLKLDRKTGEIMMKGPFVMNGYYKDPVKTAEVIEDGWLRTGDQGHLDENGYLFITGRVKDTFKTAKGKFIAPSPIEWKFGFDENIEQICILGLGCPQPIALVVPSGIGRSKPKDELQICLSHTLGKVNDKLPNNEKVSTIVITQEEWNMENGLLTPTLKVKRHALNKRYSDLLLGWHEHNDSVVWE
jgi:long-chain acyl-CoA synthetase